MKLTIVFFCFVIALLFALELVFFLGGRVHFNLHMLLYWYYIYISLNHQQSKVIPQLYRQEYARQVQITREMFRDTVLEQKQ